MLIDFPTSSLLKEPIGTSEKYQNPNIKLKSIIKKYKPSRPTKPYRLVQQEYEKIDYRKQSEFLEKRLNILLIYVTKNLKTSNFNIKPEQNYTNFLRLKRLYEIMRKVFLICSQWKAHYECYLLSLNPGSFSISKIEKIYKNLENQQKFFLNIEIIFKDKKVNFKEFKPHQKLNVSKKVTNIKEFNSYDIFNDDKEFLLFDLNSKFFDLTFLFYGIEKNLFFMLKKEYYLNQNSYQNQKPLTFDFTKQTLIFDKNQIIVVHQNDMFLKKFSHISITYPFNNWKRENCFFNPNINSSTIQMNLINSFLPYEKNLPGLDFLGLHIRHLNKTQHFYQYINLDDFRQSKFNKLNLSRSITPSLANIRSHLEQLRAIIKQNKTITQELLITKLSPKIRG